MSFAQKIRNMMIIAINCLAFWAAVIWWVV